MTLLGNRDLAGVARRGSARMRAVIERATDQERAARHPFVLAFVEDWQGVRRASPPD